VTSFPDLSATATYPIHTGLKAPPCRKEIRNAPPPSPQYFIKLDSFPLTKLLPTAGKGEELRKEKEGTKNGKGGALIVKAGGGQRAHAQGEGAEEFRWGRILDMST